MWLEQRSDCLRLIHFANVHKIDASTINGERSTLSGKNEQNHMCDLQMCRQWKNVNNFFFLSVLFKLWSLRFVCMFGYHLSIFFTYLSCYVVVCFVLVLFCCSHFSRLKFAEFWPNKRTSLAKLYQHHHHRYGYNYKHLEWIYAHTHTNTRILINKYKFRQAMMH